VKPRVVTPRQPRPVCRATRGSPRVTGWGLGQVIYGVADGRAATGVASGGTPGIPGTSRLSRERRRRQERVQTDGRRRLAWQFGANRFSDAPLAGTRGVEGGAVRVVGRRALRRREGWLFDALRLCGGRRCLSAELAGWRSLSLACREVGVERACTYALRDGGGHKAWLSRSARHRARMPHGRLKQVLALAPER